VVSLANFRDWALKDEIDQSARRMRRSVGERGRALSTSGGARTAVDRHEQNWQRAKGFLAAASVLFAVIEVAVEAWFRK
jgi:hypothetical protein